METVGAAQVSGVMAAMCGKVDLMDTPGQRTVEANASFSGLAGKDEEGPHIGRSLTRPRL